MGEKRINFRKIIKGIKRQGIRMQQRLIVYWCVVILTLFLATVLLLSIIGVLPGMDFKVREMLSAQQKNTLSAMTEQTDIMMARSISLSEDITKELNQCLTANGKTFSKSSIFAPVSFAKRSNAVLLINITSVDFATGKMESLS